MPTLEDAIALAAEAHKDQKDKAGAPYILHPLRVMLSRHMTSCEHRIAAVLHDVVEDTEINAAYLRAQGYSDVVLAAIESVTKREGEDYFSRVRRAAVNPIGRCIKRADLEDNMDLSRIANPTQKDLDRTKKYIEAHKLLLDLVVEAS
jgi:(p)ppGpp synthase/HD superfamily hydrolase